MFIYFVVVIILCLLFNNPILLFTIILSNIFLSYSDDGGKTLKSHIKIYSFMIISVALINPLISTQGENILFYIVNRPITLESLIFGAVMALSITAMLISFTVFNQFITAEKLLYIINLAFPKSGLLSVMIVRLIPLFRLRIRDIADVQKTRGGDIYEGKTVQRLKNAMGIVNSLVFWSIDDAFQSAQIMRARGFGCGKRSFYHIFKMDKYDRIWAVLFALGGALLIINGVFWKLGTFDIYPQLGKAFFSSPAFFCYYFIFILYLFVPFILQLRGRMT